MKKLNMIIYHLKIQNLLYWFNDFQNSIGEPLIKVKHSVVTDNYIAAEEIQIKIGKILLNAF